MGTGVGGGGWNGGLTPLRRFTFPFPLPHMGADLSCSIGVENFLWGGGGCDGVWVGDIFFPYSNETE